MSLDQIVDLEFVERLELPVGSMSYTGTCEFLSVIKAARLVTSMLCTLSDSMLPTRLPRSRG